MKKSKFFVFLAIILALGIALGGCAVQIESVNSALNGSGGSDIAVESDTTEKQTVNQTENTTQSQTETQTEQETQKVSKYSSEDKLVALTFDDGPRNSTTNRILDMLEKYNGAATFFIVGYNIENNIKTIKRAVDMGCEIANHSDGHLNLTKCTPDEIRAQVNNPIEAVKKHTGYDVKLFRAPGGNFKGVEEIIGLPLIQWSIDTEDWKFKDAAHPDRTAEARADDIESIVDRVILQVKKGDIILMHDIYDFTADLCEALIPRLVEEGFTLATVSEMYEAYGKELEGGKVYRSIRIAEPAQAVTAMTSGAYLVGTGGHSLIIREKADANSAMLGKIPDGTVVLTSQSVPGWSYVTYESVSGWVSAKYLMKF